ncbi:MAG TPA: ComF family protein [Anaerolineae bacterium]|nr:ComF family protein [Anaerolineae bacterium]HPL30154.1 ComF family protein [Anaerolineae bacterium]
MPQRLFSGLLDLLFPPRCAGCGRPGSWLCTACLTQVAWIAPPLCPRCGEPARAPACCPRRHRHPEHLDGLRSAAWHSGPLRAALHRLKYRGQRVLAAPLAGLVVAAWRRDPPPAGLLIPVPLHPTRVRERGFNQAALLAAYVGRELGLPVDARHLARIRATPPQVGLSAGQRLVNVAGAFRYSGPSLHGRAVCLIDDICTTGATLEACAAALREAGAASVWAYTVARPRWDAADRDA